MKFTYQYRTSDNVAHQGTINAPTRDAVFVALKAKGIRPGRVDEAPGLLNHLIGRCKRWNAVAILAVALTSVLVFWIWNTVDEGVNSSAIPSTSDFLLSQTRRQVIGDAAFIEKGIRTGWASVFPHEGERFLASFAIPGVPAGQRNSTEEEVRQALTRKCDIEIEDGIETRQIKAMVEGMKQELRTYLAAGGSVVGYGHRLVERQESEIAYYERAKNEIEAACASGTATDKVLSLWESKNDELRRMGIRLVPFPD